MKYCTKCGAQMNDDALFCSKCGAKVEEGAEQQPASVAEAPKVEPSKPVKTRTRAQIQRVPLEEQSEKQFLPVPLALLGCSIVIWIINGVASTSGITRIMPLVLFMLLSGFFGAMSIIRALKTYKKELYFRAALAFVLFILLVTSFIIDFVFLIQS